MAKRSISLATLLSLAILAVLCTTRVILTAKAQAAPPAYAHMVELPAPTQSPARIDQGGLIYVVNHGAWG